MGDCDCGESISVGSAGHLREVACFISLFCNDTLWFPSCPTLIYDWGSREFAEILTPTAQIR